MGMQCTAVSFFPGVFEGEPLVSHNVFFYYYFFIFYFLLFNFLMHNMASIILPNLKSFESSGKYIPFKENNLIYI